MKRAASAEMASARQMSGPVTHAEYNGGIRSGSAGDLWSNVETLSGDIDGLSAYVVGLSAYVKTMSRDVDRLSDIVGGLFGHVDGLSIKAGGLSDKTGARIDDVISLSANPEMVSDPVFPLSGIVLCCWALFS